MAWTTWLHVCHCVPGDLHNMESKVLPLQKDMPLCLAEAINVPVPPLQGEWYLSSLIRNICCAHAHSLSLPPLSPKGILPHPPSLRKQRIFLIVYPPPPSACLFVCQQVIKICLLLPRRSTPVETAAAEPRSWSPLLHADDLNLENMKNNTPPPTTGNHSELNATSGLTFILCEPPLLWRPNSQMSFYLVFLCGFVHFPQFWITL